MEYQPMITTHMKKGFTLAELVVSIAIFLIIFSILTEGFLTVMKISRQIDINRELTLYSSKILNTLATDIDELKIDTSSFSEDMYSFSLTRNDQTKVTYTLKKMDPQDLSEYYSNRKIPDSAQGNIYTLSRKNDVDLEQKYISENFVLVNPHFIKTPNTSLPDSKCTFLPALTFTAKIVYLPKLSGDMITTSSDIQTTFSTPEDPSHFSQTCSKKS